MGSPDLSQFRWRESSRSANQGECVEIGLSPPGGAAVRDSKAPTGPALILAPVQLAGFLGAVTAGRFDLD